MNDHKQLPFPIVVYGGSTAASTSGSENSSACPDSLASMFRDAVVVYELSTADVLAQPGGPGKTTLQPTGGKAAGG